MSNFNKSEHFWGSKKAFEILANLGLEPLAEDGEIESSAKEVSLKPRTVNAERIEADFY